MGVSVLRLFISSNEGSIYHFTTDRSKAVVAVFFDLCVFLWLLPAGLFNRLLSCLLPYWCVKWILSNSVDTLLGKKQQATLFSLPCGTCTVWQDLSRAVIGTLYSKIILKTLQPKERNFPIKNSDISHISAQKHRLWVLARRF